MSTPERRTFIDIHIHCRKTPGLPRFGKQAYGTPEQLMARQDELDIECSVILPGTNPEHAYQIQSNEEALEICAEHPDRFVPFCNIHPRQLTNSADAPLGDLLRYYRDQGCKGLGEFMPNLRFLDPLVQNVFKHAQNVGFPLTFDISDRLGARYGLVDDPGLPELERTLRRFPKLKILGHGPAFWAEIGRLDAPEDRTGYPKYPVREEGAVPKLLRRYENLLGDLSAKSGFNALNRDHAYADQFLNEFQDKLYFGTDICLADQRSALADLLRAFRHRGTISESVFDKIARANAVRLLGL